MPSFPILFEKLLKFGEAAIMMIILSFQKKKYMSRFTMPNSFILRLKNI